MPKVRWSTKCAGGCGRWLTSGTFATHAYGGWWCDACVKIRKAKHAALRK